MVRPWVYESTSSSKTHVLSAPLKDLFMYSHEEVGFLQRRWGLGLTGLGMDRKLALQVADVPVKPQN